MDDELIIIIDEAELSFEEFLGYGENMFGVAPYGDNI